MNIERCRKARFVVIGKEGSTRDGEGFIQRLWAQANAGFAEVNHLALRDEQGQLLGIWGAMSDCSRRFLPWQEDFTQGLYLAGVECGEAAQAPAGWTRWTVPGGEFLRVENAEPDTFRQALRFLREQNLPLVGAVHDFTCPQTGKNYLYFPIGLE